MLEVPNWPYLKEISIFWHHLPFSGTVWNLNPNFDTEFLRLFFFFWFQGRVMGSNANSLKKIKIRKYIVSRGYFFSTFIGSKNGSIRPFKPINRGRHTHVPRSELNSDRDTWVCRPRFIGLNGRIGPFFDPIKVESVYSQGVYRFSILVKNGFEPMNPYNFSCWIRFRHYQRPEMGPNINL